MSWAVWYRQLCFFVWQRLRALEQRSHARYVRSCGGAIPLTAVTAGKGTKRRVIHDDSQIEIGVAGHRYRFPRNEPVNIPRDALRVLNACEQIEYGEDGRPRIVPAFRITAA